MKITRITVAVAMLATIASMSTGALADGRTTGRGTGPVVYVESQGLFYDSIVLANLPMKGRFQKLKPGAGPDGALATEFGPGDPGYLGGRWWVDANGDGEMNEGDAFFLCPLLAPGRSME
jgi:hypothetical protein